MDTILIGLTVLSLTSSIILGVLLTRVLREERRRSDARVSLLTQLAAEGSPAEPRIAFRDFNLRAEQDEASAATGTLFAEHDEPSPWPRRVLAAGAAVIAVGLLVTGWNAFEPASSPASQIAAAPQPLELLSLAHKQQADGLTITGLVQNPRTAGDVANVQATALVFSGDGTLLATGRAPLDFTTLAPGTESPFVIRVQAVRAARYRVAFRGADGQPLPHVDRRNLEAVVRKELP